MAGVMVLVTLGFRSSNVMTRLAAGTAAYVGLIQWRYTNIILWYGGCDGAGDLGLPLQQRHDASGRRHRGAEVRRKRQRLTHHPSAENQRF